MKFVDEFRDAGAVRSLAERIARGITRPWTLMEICGGQTHAILRYGLDRILPEAVTLVHGPGCPVCVTPAEAIDRAIALALRDGVTLCSFGDMLRVPGSARDLMDARAHGADVRAVYSPLDAVTLARAHPDREVVFFGVGFETTAPANALAVLTADREAVPNFSLLAAHVLVPPAVEAILSSPDNRVQGFLAAGHVCTIAGYRAYDALAERWRVPIVITGFEPADILRGVLRCVVQLERGEHRVENAYPRAVRREGNAHAQEAVGRVFEITSVRWRGLGEIPRSGLRMRDAYARYDATRRFPDADGGGASAARDERCRAGDVLRGVLAPPACEHFGRACTPDTPLGAPMVSAEGACAAYFRYRIEEVARA